MIAVTNGHTTQDEIDRMSPTTALLSVCGAAAYPTAS
jgi:hypothetical protein